MSLPDSRRFRFSEATERDENYIASWKLILTVFIFICFCAFLASFEKALVNRSAEIFPPSYEICFAFAVL